jgi:hypothetical protein
MLELAQHMEFVKISVGNGGCHGLVDDVEDLKACNSPVSLVA